MQKETKREILKKKEKGKEKDETERREVGEEDQ